MTISLQYSLLINGFLAALLLLFILIGYNKGFLVQLVDLLGLVTALFIAWLLSKAVGSLFPIIPKSFVPYQKTILESFFYNFVNTIVWFVIIFVLALAVIKLLKLIVKQVDQIPILKQVNKLLGVVLALGRYLIIVFLMLYLLTTPLFKNGNEIIENSWFIYGQKAFITISDLTNNSLGNLDQLAILQDFINDPKQLSADELRIVMSWLSDHGISADKITQFISEISGSNE